MQALEKSHTSRPDYWRCLAWVYFESGNRAGVEQIQQSKYRVEDEDFIKALLLLRHTRK
jgi:hypothetical protein